MSCGGHFTTRRVIDGDGTVHVYADHADPVVHISTRMLAMAEGDGNMLIPGLVEVTRAPWRAGDDRLVTPMYQDAVVKIRCENRTVIYRVTGPCEHGAWRMEFPD